MEIGLIAIWLISIVVAEEIGKSSERTRNNEDNQIMVNEVQTIRQMVRFVGYTYISIDVENYFAIHEWVRHVMGTVEDVDRMLGALLVRYESAFDLVPEVKYAFPIDLGEPAMDWITGTGDWDDLYDLFQ